MIWDERSNELTDNTRSGEETLLHILHTDLPTTDIGTVCIDCSSDKGKMWSAPQAVKLMPGLVCRKR
jgi:hypothetical protein